MIVGCYTLDLYCDAQVSHDCTALDYRRPQPIQFTGERGANCRADARTSGWRLSVARSTAVCPACVKAGADPFALDPIAGIRDDDSARPSSGDAGADKK